MVMGRRGVVAAGHYLAAEAGVHILRSGGNAVDAAAATAFVLQVVEPHQNGLGGEVPVLFCAAGSDRVWAISGNGTAPAAADIATFRSLGVEGAIPGDGYLPALVPPGPATWTAVLRRFGTMRLAEVLAPAVELAESGFPVGDSLHEVIAGNAGRFEEEWPTSARNYMPRGRPPGVGEVWHQPDLAATLRKLIEAEEGAATREAGLKAACDRFYRGDMAAAIVDCARSTPVRDATGREHTALLTEDDFAGFAARLEETVAVEWGDLTVHKCSSWTQGPVLLQSLRLLEGLDVERMGHNTPDYIHTVVECMKLSYADREFYYGDPEFVDVPLERLLSSEYATQRRGLVEARHASMELRPGGRAPIMAKDIRDEWAAFEADWPHATGDTTKLEVADAEGNMVSATPSGGWLMSSPTLTGLGFQLGTRGQMFEMAEGHPNALAPGKRPRATLTPSLATREGTPYLAFGSPGGDCQDQWALQFLLNVTVYGMSLQEAAEAPVFYTAHFPNSFYPRAAEPGVLYVEGRIPDQVRRDLQGRGHIIKVTPAWNEQQVLGAMRTACGAFCAGVSPRRDAGYAIAF